jgi:hypothetical protein
MLISIYLKYFDIFIYLIIERKIKSKSRMKHFFKLITKIVELFMFDLTF